MTHTKQVHAGFGEKVVTLTLDCLERQASKQSVRAFSLGLNQDIDDSTNVVTTVEVVLVIEVVNSGIDVLVDVHAVPRNFTRFDQPTNRSTGSLNNFEHRTHFTRRIGQHGITSFDRVQHILHIGEQLLQFRKHHTHREFPLPVVERSFNITIQMLCIVQAIIQISWQIAQRTIDNASNHLCSR